VYHGDFFDPAGIMKARLLELASKRKRPEAIKLKNSRGGCNG